MAESETRPSVARSEPVTPELVLVDPALARHARALLDEPDHARAAPVRRRELVEVEPVARRPLGRALALCAAAGAMLLAIGVAQRDRPDDSIPVSAKPERARTPPPPTQSDAASTRTGGPPAEQAPGVKTRTSGRTSPSTRPAQTSATPRPGTAPRPGRPSPRVRRAASGRVVTWAGLPGAAGYRVELFLGSARVFSADATRPALTLPASWTFGGRRHRLAAGDYRLYIWAAVPGRPAPVLVVRSRALSKR